MGIQFSTGKIHIFLADVFSPAKRTRKEKKTSIFSEWAFNIYLFVYKGEGRVTL